VLNQNFKQQRGIINSEKDEEDHDDYDEEDSQKSDEKPV
jgi:hypothetical protein